MTLRVYTRSGEEKKEQQSLAPRAVVCRVKHVTTVGAGGSGWRKVPFDTKIIDPYGFWDLTNNRFQPTIPGYYEIDALICFNNANSSRQIAAWSKNGSTIYNYFAYGRVATESQANIGGADVVYLNGSTDYVEIWGYMDIDHSWIAGASDDNQHVAFHLIGASVGVAPEPWQTPTMAAPWTSLAGVAVGYRKDPTGRVTLRGQARNTGGAFTFGTGTGTFFTLPVGYRPAQTMYFNCLHEDALDADRTLVRVRIDTDGRVWMEGGFTNINVASGNTNSTTMLDGISFFTD